MKKIHRFKLVIKVWSVNPITFCMASEETAESQPGDGEWGESSRQAPSCETEPMGVVQYIPAVEEAAVLGETKVLLNYR